MAQWLQLKGIDSSYVSTPDSASLDITGDIDIRVRVAADSWNNTGTFDDDTIVAKDDPNTGADRSYSLLTRGNNTNALRLYWRDSGGTDRTQDSDATGFSNGTLHWVRATMDVDDGAGNRVITFYTSDDDSNDHTAVTWTLLSTHTVAGATSIQAGAAELRVGANDRAGGTSLSPLAGKVYVAAILDGIDGTVVANPIFGEPTQWSVGDVDGATGTDDQDNVWTLNGIVSIRTLRGSPP